MTEYTSVIESIVSSLTPVVHCAHAQERLNGVGHETILSQAPTSPTLHPLIELQRVARRLGAKKY